MTSFVTPSGTDLLVAADALCKMAALTGERATSDFNGVVLKADARSEPSDVIAAYYQTVQQQAEAAAAYRKAAFALASAALAIPNVHYLGSRFLHCVQDLRAAVALQEALRSQLSDSAPEQTDADW